jgi:hypothetical protein
VAGSNRPLQERRPPQRSCVACRTARAKRELVRIVRAPDGAISIDDTGRAAGRGAYLCRDAACWQTAGRKRAVEHALGSALPDAIAQLLAAGPDAPAATTINNPAGAQGTRPMKHPDPMTQGGARGQE